MFKLLSLLFWLKKKLPNCIVNHFTNNLFMTNFIIGSNDKISLIKTKTKSKKGLKYLRIILRKYNNLKKRNTKVILWNLTHLQIKPGKNSKLHICRESTQNILKSKRRRIILLSAQKGYLKQLIGGKMASLHLQAIKNNVILAGLSLSHLPLKVLSL